MSNLPTIILGLAGLLVAIVNLAYFRDRLVWRGAAISLTGTLIAASSAALHVWWMTGVAVVLVAWGGLIVLGAAPDRPPADPAALNERMAEAFTEWAKREGMPGTVNEARSFMAGYVKGRADLRQAKGARR